MRRNDDMLRARCLIAASLALMAMATLPVAMWYWSAWR